MTYKFKVGDTGKTERGRDYRVICDDARDTYGLPKIVVLLEFDRFESPYRCSPDGYVIGLGPRENDRLLPPKQKLEGWVNVYSPTHNAPVFHATKDAAIRGSASNRIACVFVSVEYTPGEGLE